eukprot:6395153-Amphidinium_carterae.1
MQQGAESSLPIANEQQLLPINSRQVQWTRNQLTFDQAVDAGVPAGYHTGNVEADLLASQA